MFAKFMQTAAAVAILATPALAAPDTITLAMVLEPPNLDPTGGAAAAIDEIVYANLFEGLTRIASDGSVQPGLAAIRARPRRLRSDQPHAGASAVEVHLVLGRQQRRDVVGHARRQGPLRHARRSRHARGLAARGLTNVAGQGSVRAFESTRSCRCVPR